MSSVMTIFICRNMVQVFKMIPDTVPCSVVMFVMFIVVVYVMR